MDLGAGPGAPVPAPDGVGDPLEHEEYRQTDEGCLDHVPGPLAHHAEQRVVLGTCPCRDVDHRLTVGGARIGHRSGRFRVRGSGLCQFGLALTLTAISSICVVPPKD
jgi:hypothetical protein